MALRLPEIANHGEPWTVSDLTTYIRELFDVDFRLGDLHVRGEISNFSQARSGHCYFTLKDERAQLKCVMWRSSAERLRFHPSDGDEVVARGHVTVYEAGGVYQLYVQTLRPVGRGDLAEAFEILKARLAEEGLFDVEHKKRIPRFPKKIGIVTSIDAAALRDVLNVLRRRYPLVSVLIAPSLVQGVDAPAQIVRALRWIDGRDDIDTIILTRGGGSIEDLWAFNDEEVARAIFLARHPVICGIGHETDFTIADFAADLRAPTPSAAAELAVPDIAELHPYLRGVSNTLVTRLNILIEGWRQQHRAFLRELRHVGPRARLDNNRQLVDSIAGRLERAAQLQLHQSGNRVALAEARLTSVSPLATLARGYAIVRREDGFIVTTVRSVDQGDRLYIQVSDGEISAITDVQITDDGAAAHEP